MPVCILVHQHQIFVGLIQDHARSEKYVLTSTTARRQRPLNTAFKYIENPNLYPILLAMIERASLPLKAVEENFAVDSTGFCRFDRWFDIKHNRFTAKQGWVKTHLMCGIKTNVVTAVEIHGQDSGDVLHLPALVETTRCTSLGLSRCSKPADNLIGPVDG